MSRKTTLIHRGYLYAQGKVQPVSVFDKVTVGNASAERMKLAHAWRAGYLARMYDTRHASKSR